MRLDSNYYDTDHPEQHQGAHGLCVEEFGNPKGVPLLCLPENLGLPRSPLTPRLVDPKYFRILVVTDQMSCLAHQRNPEGVWFEHLERLRRQLGIDKWVLMGFSWGANLALQYAQAYQEQVLAMLMGSVFLAREADIDWWWQGPAHMFPDLHQTLCEQLGSEDPTSMRERAYNDIHGNDKAKCLPSARALINYLRELQHESPVSESNGTWSNDAIIRGAKLLTHYDHHNYFLKENVILRRIDNIRHIPARILQGRFDPLTPPRQSFDLHRAWPEANYQLIPASAHSWHNPHYGHAVRWALDQLKRAIGPRLTVATSPGR